MHMESLWPVVITAGIFAATLSSALASLVSAPKVFQVWPLDLLISRHSRLFAKTNCIRRLVTSQRLMEKTKSPRGPTSWHLLSVSLWLLLVGGRIELEERERFKVISTRLLLSYPTSSWPLTLWLIMPVSISPSLILQVKPLLECLQKSFAGFRPAFKYYNMWVSLFGSLLCVVVMFIISWVTAFITFVCFASLFVYLHHRKPSKCKKV